MAQAISGIYLMLEGSEADVQTVSMMREPTWITDDPDNHALRVVDSSGIVHKIYEHPISNKLDYDLVDGNGVHSGMVISIGTPTSTFTISSGIYHKIGNDGNDVVYNGVTNQSVTNIATQNQTYIAINTANNAVVQQANEFTPTQRRTHVILGVLIHTNNSTINAVNNLPDVSVNTLSQLNDFMTELKGFNVNGNVISANGANLSINKSMGEVFKKGSNFTTDPTNPHLKNVAALVAPNTIRMRQSNGTESSNTNVIDLQYESPLGTLTPIPNNRYGVFRVALFPSNLIRIQYPQYIYHTMAEAQNGISSEGYILENNISENGLIRGFIIIRGATTALNNTANAKFLQADKFGEMPFGGSGGGLTTLQGAYDNSIEPEIITNTTLGAVTIQRGSAADTDNVLEIKNGSGVIQLYAKGTGENNFYPYTDIMDATGFTDPTNIAVTYNSTNRTITLTGNVKALWRGRVVSELVSGWVSPAHPTTLDQNYFLYYNGTTFVWSTTAWTFDVLQISEVYFKTTNKFGVREVHGFMDPSTHQECHYNFGTWRKSGGAFSSFTLNSTTAANRRPVLRSSIIVDEDIETTNAQVSSGQYTRFNLIGLNGNPETALDQEDVISVGANGRFNYNLNTSGTWSVTESVNNAYGKIFVINIPVTADAGSQKFRTIYLMPQTTSLTLTDIQAITPASYNWGVLTGAGVSEFVFVGEIIVQSTTNNWQLIYVGNINGNRITQVTIHTSATPSLSQVLTVGNNGNKKAITNLGNLDSGDLVINSGIQTGKWQVGPTIFAGNNPTMYGFVTNSTANGSYTYQGIRDAGSGYGSFSYYRRGTTQWYLLRQGWYWLITENISNPEWATSIAHGAGGLNTPDGFYIKYGNETGTNIYCTMTAGSAIVDSLVVEGSMFCDSVIKANDGFNVNGNLAITDNLIKYKDYASIYFENDNLNFNGVNGINTFTPGNIYTQADGYVTIESNNASVSLDSAFGMPTLIKNGGFSMMSIMDTSQTLPNTSITTILSGVGRQIITKEFAESRYLTSGNYVKGPISSTDGYIPLFDGTSGNLLRKSGMSISCSDGGGQYCILATHPQSTMILYSNNISVDLDASGTSAGSDAFAVFDRNIDTVNPVFRAYGNGEVYANRLTASIISGVASNSKILITKEYANSTYSTIPGTTFKVVVSANQTDVAYNLTSASGELNFATGTPLSGGYSTRLKLKPYTANNIWIPTLIGATENINSAITSVGDSALITKGYADATYSAGSSALSYQFGYAVSGQYIGTTAKYIPAAGVTDLVYTDLVNTDKFRTSIIDAGNLTKWSYSIRETTHDGTIAQSVTIKAYKNGTAVATVTIAQGASTRGVYTLGTPQSFAAGDELSFSIESNVTGVTLDGITIVAKVG